MATDNTVQSAGQPAEAKPNVSKSPIKTAARLGMVSCHHCATLWKDVKAHDRCGRCGARLHMRRPDSLNRTWALLIAACIMYIPANTLPVMITLSFPREEQQDTIMSGIIYFW